MRWLSISTGDLIRLFPQYTPTCAPARSQEAIAPADPTHDGGITDTTSETPAGLMDARGSGNGIDMLESSYEGVIGVGAYVTGRCPSPAIATDSTTPEVV